MIITRFLPLVTLTLSVGLCSSLASAQRISVQLDGKPAMFYEAQPQMINGMVYIPLRGVFEQMGATIDWDPNQRVVTGMRGNHRVVMRAEGNSAMVDNRSIHMDGRATIIDGSVMVPLRFVSEALGAQVDWNDTSQTVNIRSEDGHFISRGLRKPNQRGDMRNRDQHNGGDRQRGDRNGGGG